MNERKTEVLNHFERVSGAFDSIYEGRQKSLLYKTVDILFRRSILDRRMKTMIGFAGDVRDKEVLDIGCGPGRYAVPLALSGPRRVLGLDISQEMIELAEKISNANNISGVCKFLKRDFMQTEFDTKFDIVIASGVFDYIADPVEFLSKIKAVTRGRVIISFPVKWTILTFARMAWLRKRKCPNYYYSEGEIKRLFRKSGLEIAKISRIGSFLVPGNYIVMSKTY